jgi:PAS domain S-box-containing protein
VSNIGGHKVELVKSLLRAIHGGARPEELSTRFREVLSEVSPAEIVLIEQQLVREGVPVGEILKLCDLHVQLFREYLASRELSGVPRGHPLDLLIRENELISKLAEVLGLYASAVLGSPRVEREVFERLRRALHDLRSIRLHYRKVQMLIFPYLERRGIVAVPRVLWGREDQVVVKIREAIQLAEKAVDDQTSREVARRALEISREVAELVFRENRVLFPAVWALFTEGEWAAIAEIAREFGYLVPVDVEWVPSARPVLPYEVPPEVSREVLERLPPEFRQLALARLEPDTYSVRKEGDLELSTGFLKPEEFEAILSSLPLEITYADENDRVRFYSRSRLLKGFARSKTILGRRLLFCHPPRLEAMVKNVVERLKRGEVEYREYWTRQGNRILRVVVAPVRGRDGRYLGTLEVVEDLTEVVRNPEEVMKRVLVL